MPENIKHRIHQKLLDKKEELEEWYQGKLKGSFIPFYSSFDIRDAGFKIGNVDGNAFPAGFNNICQMDKDLMPEAVSDFLNRFHPKAKHLLLLTEDHLRNTYYWDNIAAIREILMEAGYQVTVGMLAPTPDDPLTLTSFTGQKVCVYNIQSEKGQLLTRNGVPDLVITNNDFSNVYENINFSATEMNPPRELGWYQRKKYSYFNYYNDLVCEFSQHIDEDPWLFHVTTQRLLNFDVDDESSNKNLALKVDETIEKVKKKYREYNIDENPYVFIKNNSGTYGLGVVEVTSGKDVRNLNYKSKKKLKASKGGSSVSEVIIQEGIRSTLRAGEATAEPVLYMVGDAVVGGFLRTHDRKNPYQSLNSPGAVYKRLCLGDLKVDSQGCTLENVYGWLAKIGLLAITQEISIYQKSDQTN